MATVSTVCEECEGRRFQASVLEYTLGGRNISEVLAMSVTEAEGFFGAGEARIPAAHAVPDRLADVGAQLDAAITPRTKAIMLVHLTGRVCRMDALRKIRSQVTLKACSADPAERANLATQQAAIRAALPAYPNEKIVYSCKADTTP